MSEIFKERPWPFEGHQFPDDLGVVAVRSVAQGEADVLEVTHFPDNSWGMTDGSDPNIDGAAIVTHLRHVLERDPSLLALALLPPGYIAFRDTRTDPWRLATFQWAD